MTEERENQRRLSEADTTADDPPAPARKIVVLGREFHLPRSRWVRVSMGSGLVVLGIFGFLPVLGFWMIPLGLLVLSHEFHMARRLRRRFVVWWEKRRKRS